MSLLLFCKGVVKAQNSLLNSQYFYNGGLDSLNRDIEKNLNITEKEVLKDCFLFFEISLNRNGFKKITELYKQPDIISKALLGSIEKTATNWTKGFKKNDKIILPVFLIVDKESGAFNKEFYHTTTQNEYKFKVSVIKCFLLPPLIINYFHNN